MAAALGISVNTVRTHIERLLQIDWKAEPRELRTKLLWAYVDHLERDGGDLAGNARFDGPGRRQRHIVRGGSLRSRDEFRLAFDALEERPACRVFELNATYRVRT